MSGRALTGFAARIDRRCGDALDDRALRIALIEEIRRAVAFDWYAWLLTDPETEVGSSPLSDFPSLSELPRLVRAKYVTPVNRWTSHGAGVVTLASRTEADLERSRTWREFVGQHGVVDVASVVFRDKYGCWGWLDLWRTAPGTPFDDGEVAALGGVVDVVTARLRRAQARTFDMVGEAAVPRDPAVLVLTPDLGVAAQTRETDDYLRALLPSGDDRPPVPAAAYNVAAQLLAVEQGVDAHEPRARVHLGEGTWLTLRAARVGQPGPALDQDIAVTIMLASPGERRSLFGLSHALSPREREVVDLVAHGADTHTIAARMFLSEHTVQDHLKSVFAKTGTRNRRSLVSRLAGG